jgi:hypothetical protein
MKGDPNLKAIFCPMQASSQVLPACPPDKPNVTKLKGSRGAAAKHSGQFCAHIQFLLRSNHSTTEGRTINKWILRIIGDPQIHYVDRTHSFEMVMQVAQYTAPSNCYTLQTPLYSAHAVF